MMRHDYRQKMLQRILLATVKGLDALTMHIAEDRRVRWTTFTNISSWFDNWELDLVELGFATRGADGKVATSAEQLYFIINFDEMCLSVDGSEGRRGGRPEVTLHPRLPYTGKRTNKDSLMATLVMGSNQNVRRLPSQNGCPGSGLSYWLVPTLTAKSSLQQVGVMCVRTIFLKLKHFWRGRRRSQRKQN